MPLTTDEAILATSRDLLQQFDTLFGLHPGFRPAHAKGILVSGAFRPATHASTLSRAPHLVAAATPVTVRFSNSTGLPAIPDNDPNADPRGIAVRFHLGEHRHTDIVAHSANGFPTRTGEEFLEFLRAVVASPPGTPSPTAVERFLGSHPAALAYVQMPKPAPASFARQSYFGLTAMRFTNAAGERCYGRYRLTPAAGIEHLDQAALAARQPDFLFDELRQRLARGPVSFLLVAQLAEEGDVVEDVTRHWPETRRLFELGTLELNALVPDEAHEQKQIIFDPIPRVDGIEPSDDPLLELRAAVYLMSGRRRRSAPES
jgi:catalase